MDKVLNYDLLFSKAVSKVLTIRNPRPEKPELADLKWKSFNKQKVFLFGNDDSKKYYQIMKEVESLSLHVFFEYILFHLNKLYKCGLVNIDISEVKGYGSKIIFGLEDKKNSTLLLFKDIEESPAYWPEEAPKDIQDLMKNKNLDNLKYIYLVHDGAYIQVRGYNDEENDPGRGLNLFGVKWLFETYFSSEEYERFYAALQKYIRSINYYVGYIVLKSLNSSALINFKKIVENTVNKYSYESILEKKVRGKDDKGNKCNFKLGEDDFHIINKQFKSDNMISIVIGNRDFAESFITAEWLFTTMKHVRAVDLTVIGMGYFKSVEQLLYDLICLHKDEGRSIKRNKSSHYVDLSESNIIKNNYLDTTFGSMANFYKNNLDILRSDLSENGKKFIEEMIFSYSNLRNGFFHKDNIRDWKVIEEIRQETLYMIYLLLGGQELKDSDSTFLGKIPENQFDDYYRLCEYINYHSYELFIIDLGDGDQSAIAYPDENLKIIDNNYIQYSGVYFKEFGGKKRVCKFDKDFLPKSIYTAKFLFYNTKEPEGKLVKCVKIFENGTFIGASIVDEEFDY